MLIHHDLSRNLWIDLDAFKEFGFEAIFFHIKQGEEEVPKGKWPLKSIIKPLLFFLRLFSSAEKNYWPMKLEIAGFV